MKMKLPRLTAIAFVATFAQAFAPASGRAQATIAFNARSEIQKTLEQVAKSKTKLEWIASDSNPAPLFERFQASLSSSQWNQVCEALDEISVIDLAYFEEEIDSPLNAGLTSCRTHLQDKLKRYWQEAQLRMLEPMFGFNAFGDGGTLPSREEHLDTTSGPELFRGDLKDGEICLTFDDGPHSVHTPAILEILASFGVRANFFEVGKNAKEFPQHSLAAAQAGHIMGSHSWSHPQLSKLDLDHSRSEITAGREAVAQASQTTIPFFRFPYGERKTVTPLRSWLRDDHYAMFYWNMDSLDWKLNDPSALLKSVLNEINREKGGIILFHDVHPQTVIVLPQVLQELKRRNFTTIVYLPH